MPSLISRLVNAIKKLLLRQVSYLDAQAYQLSAKHGLLAQPALTGKILLVSRHGYTEHIQWLPVTRSAEAKKLVKFQQSSRGEGWCYCIGQPLNGKTPVLWYQFKPQVLAHNAWLYLPETLLLAQQCSTDEVLIYQTPDSNNNIFVSQTHAGAASALKGGMLQSAMQFMLAHGGNVQQTSTLSAPELAPRLLQALGQLHRLPLAGFVNKAAFKRTTGLHALLRYVWPTVAGITLYLLLADAWTGHLQQQSRLQLQQANRQANQLLIQRDDIDSMVSRYQQLQQVLPASDNLLQLWQVLAPLYQQTITVSHVQQRLQQVTLRIEAPSATEALQLLMQQPGVVQGRLEGNVRRQNNRDLATVSFQLQQEAP
ncbi:hypothetical protein WG68_03285 [Arsukibacterium ikkense]|uniref:Uncharacterized protein n=1 Tax=Arsukibacterium ikkense TaxID=336831 RepID=A0A0M2VBH5_9GAMM|nr:hypothetical protein [Arsukibacterium ikkense]KKO46970.1 hypothetical protein WG68_03285 [Arsukibacterium ikkense]